MQNIILKKYNSLHLTQKFAIAIPALFILSCFTKHYVQRFRPSIEFRWIYEYGSNYSLSFSVLLVVFSLVNSVLIFKDLKTKPNTKLFWLLLSSSVFLYIVSELYISY